MTTPRPWQARPSGLSVRVRLTPRSSRDAILAVEDTADGPALAARVRAVPSEGEANTALQRLLASWLGVPKSTVEVTSGSKSRVKLLTVAGDPVVLERAILEKLSRLANGEER